MGVKAPAHNSTSTVSLVQTNSACLGRTKALSHSAWNESTVGGEFRIQLGKMIDAAKNRGVIKPYVGNRAVQWGRVLLDDLATCPMSASDLQRYRLQAGDLLVCEGGEIGRAAVWDAPIDECYFQKAIHRLRSLNGYEPNLLLYFLQFWTSRGTLDNFVTQTSIAHLPKESFARVPLPVPPSEERLAIAAALSDVDGLIASLDRLIAKKRAIKQAAMQQLLTGKTRLPGFTGEWVPTSLRNLGRTYGGLTGKAGEDFGHGDAQYVPFLNIMNNVVLDPTYLEAVNVAPTERQNEVMQGDLFFNGSSETPEEVGMCAVLLEPLKRVFVNSFCFGFRLFPGAAVDGLYLAYYLRSAEGRRLMYSLAQGATRHNLSKTALLALKFPLPALDEQRAISAVLSEMDSAIEAASRRRDKAKAIKQGMMQALLTGRVRLPVKAAAGGTA